MRTLPMLTGALLILAATSLISCRPSRVYADNRDKDQRDDRDDRDDRDYRSNRDYYPAPPPPPPVRTYASFSLIISPYPGFVMNRYPDGRYYHRNSAGFMYWKGYDNRFYLDRSFLPRVRYSQGEYNQWKRFSKSNNGRGNARGRRY